MHTAEDHEPKLVTERLLKGKIPSGKCARLLFCCYFCQAFYVYCRIFTSVIQNYQYWVPLFDFIGLGNRSCKLRAELQDSPEMFFFFCSFPDYLENRPMLSERRQLCFSSIFLCSN